MVGEQQREGEHSLWIGAASGSGAQLAHALAACCLLPASSSASVSAGYKLNVWDVGGQQTIRSYWRNYYEQTDGLVFVIDSADQRRMEMCKAELHQLLKQEVSSQLSQRTARREGGKEGGMDAAVQLQAQTTEAAKE